MEACVRAEEKNISILGESTFRRGEGESTFRRGEMPLLVVKEPWASMLLDGRKTMEIRGSACRKEEGTVVHIAKSGTSLVYGSVRFVRCVGPLSDSDFEALHPSHLANGEVCSYPKKYGWVFDTPVLWEEPVPYTHPQGAIGWVKWSPSVNARP